MIETVENGVQTLVALACAVLAATWAVRNRGGSAVQVLFFFANFALADLFSQLYLIIYNMTPEVFYVSDLGWYASYLFLYLLLQELMDPQERKVRHVLLWACPAFCFGMSIFYMQWGDYPGNTICAVLMSMLLYHTVRGLMYMHAHPEKGKNKPIYIASLAFCVIEYSTWTASCFWVGDTWANLYFVFDSLMTVCLVMIMLAYRKVVRA